LDSSGFSSSLPIVISVVLSFPGHLPFLIHLFPSGCSSLSYPFDFAVSSFVKVVASRISQLSLFPFGKPSAHQISIARSRVNQFLSSGRRSSIKLCAITSNLKPPTLLHISLGHSTRLSIHLAYVLCRGYSLYPSEYHHYYKILVARFSIVNYTASFRNG
jgi:hypothetical protein